MKTKISFRPKDNKNKSLVMMIVNCGLKKIDLTKGISQYIPVRISTGIYVEPSTDWDIKLGYFSNAFVRKNPRAKIICDKMEVSAFEGVEALRITRGTHFSKDDVKKEILNRMGTEKQRPDVQMTYLFSDFIEKYIDSNKINSNTLKTYKSFLKKVSAFNTSIYPLDVVNLNNQNVKDFFDFLSSRFNYTTNTFDKNIGIFSTFITKCRESKIPTISDLNILNTIKKPRYTPDDIYLTFEEIELIRKYESPDAYKNRVRDIFVILCLTGQRVDEYKFIESGDIIVGEFRGQVYKYINIVPKITNNKKKIVCIPILKPVNEITDRWNGFPEKVPDQKINEIIKEICEDVGIDSTVHIREQRIRGNELLKKKRFEIVTTHTGRRSFITNFLALGVQDAILSRITGHVGRHNASKAFAQYIKLDGAQNIALFFQEIETNIELGKIDLPFDLTYKT